MFDISQSAQALTLEDEGTDVAILDQNDNPAKAADGSPVTIRVVGSYSQKYRDAEDAVRERAMNDRGQQISGEESRKRQTEFVADLVIGFHGFSDNGKEVPFNRANVVDLFTRLPFVQSQVERSAVNHRRFLQLSSTNSSPGSNTTTG